MWVILAMPGTPLQHGASAFIPYLNHLMGQPSQPRASAQSAQDALGGSSGGGSTASSTITVSSKPFSTSGILGCLSSKDWAVRRAAADAVHAVVLLVGPLLEPEDCWGLGDPGSVTGRCLSALEECRFDKVRSNCHTPTATQWVTSNSSTNAVLPAEAAQPFACGTSSSKVWPSHSSYVTHAQRLISSGALLPCTGQGGS